jgi:hypothetical protein
MDKKLQAIAAAGAQTVSSGQVGDGAEPVCQPRKVGVVRSGNHVLGAEFRAARHHPLQAGHVDLR